MSTSVSPYYIGLISGTSVDGIDAAIIKSTNQHIDVIAADCFPLPKRLTESIHQLCRDDSLLPDQLDDSSSLLVKTHRQLGVAFAAAAMDLLEKTELRPSDITAIGSHGQTVRHQPPVLDNNGHTIKNGLSLQIGCADTIARQTGITTISNFRAADMAAGGQGAPLAPALHAAIAPQDKTVAFLNLGGIANITLVQNGELFCGYDTGPANTLMDAWINQQKGKPYDKNGEWATSGTANKSLLDKLLADPYFDLPAPKSTGREYFNLDWLEKTGAPAKLPTHQAADIQATLLALTAHSIANEVNKLTCTPKTIYCCGGGSRNRALTAAIAEQLPYIDVTTTEALGIDPDYVEAALFAWLAKKNVEGETVDLRVVTGADTATTPGVKTEQ